MPARTEWPLSELDAALDRLEELNQQLGRAQMHNGYANRRENFKPLPTEQLLIDIARQREIVRRIANGESE